jgi:hypothetical protein
MISRMTLIIAAVIVCSLLLFGATFGLRGARRAEKHIGAWAWVLYVGLGTGMMFGAMSVQQVLISTFMWTKLTVLIATGLWLVSGRIRRRERVLPGLRVLAGIR